MPRIQRTNGHNGNGRGKNMPKIGRPEHEPTAQLRKDVANYAATGYGHEKIALCIGISVPTLYKYYRHELDFAEMEMLGVARSKLDIALKAGEPWAIKFVFETKGKSLGWSSRIEHTGADGAGLFDLSGLSDVELANLRALVSKTTYIN